jgi:hypothetical protein
MNKYTIEYAGAREDEEVEADHYSDAKEGEWIEFFVATSGGASERVLRVRATGVVRIVTER